MMIVMAWLIHCLLIAGVLTAGAYAWEAGARWSGGSARWGWMAALAGSVTLPWALRLVPQAAVESMPAAMTLPVLTLDAVTLEAGAAQAGLGLTDVAVLVWIASSALMLLYVTAALVRLARVRAGWREAELDGARVLLSRGVGPAAVGVRQAMVVVPAWALELDAELRSLLLRHEREHVRAGDPRLLLTGLVLLAAMPWNPLVWLQVLRLRNAIELDCDARVLAGGADPQRYGSLLLEVGRRRSAHALVMATFAEPRVFLEERIRRIARWPLDRRPARAAVFAVLGLVLFATALSARDPLRMPAALGVAPERELVMVSDTPPAPTFTPMTVRPELLNRDEVTESLRANYPQPMRDAGIGGAPLVWFYIDARGEVEHVRLSRSSGYPMLDDAALVVARTMRFSPARNRDAVVPVWVEIPVVFTTRGGRSLEPLTAQGVRSPAAAAERVQAEGDGRKREAPLLRQARPELVNHEQVQRAMIEAYPPLLRDAGIGGRVVVQISLAADGSVDRLLLVERSPHDALNDAAMRVASIMRFTRPSSLPAAFAMPIEFGANMREPVREPVRVPGVPRVDAPDVPPAREATPTAPPRTAGADISISRVDGPEFTPMTKRPELRGRDEVARALVRAYPPVLRDAGIGGSPVVWFFIDENGDVKRTQLSKSSGYPELDEAALAVAGVMKFAPAMNRDKPVAVWVEIPVVFTAR